MRAIEIFYTGFGDGVKPHEYGVWVHQDDHIAVEAERDALRAEVERLKAERDKDIAAAVEAAKVEMYTRANCEAWFREGGPLARGYITAVDDIFGTWRPTNEDSSADQ